MQRHLDQLNHTIQQLQDCELLVVNEPLAANQIRGVRRILEEIYTDQLKQGSRISISKKFELYCPKCNFKPIDEEVLYIHLRQKHHYSDSDTVDFMQTHRQNYDQDVATLKDLIRNYTEYLIDVD